MKWLCRTASHRILWPVCRIQKKCINYVTSFLISISVYVNACICWFSIVVFIASLKWCSNHCCCLTFLYEMSCNDVDFFDSEQLKNLYVCWCIIFVNVSLKVKLKSYLFDNLIQLIFFKIHMHVQYAYTAPALHLCVHEAVWNQLPSLKNNKKKNLFIK